MFLFVLLVVNLFIYFFLLTLIDLFWHTHLAMPTVYERDSVRLLGSVRHHKLLQTDQQTLMTPVTFESQIWRVEFNENIGVYADPRMIHHHILSSLTLHFIGLPVQPLSRRCGKREENDYAAVMPQLANNASPYYGRALPKTLG